VRVPSRKSVQHSPRCAEDADDARHARLPGAAATAAVPRAPLERHLRSKAVSDKDDGSLQVQSSLPKSLLKH